MSTSMSRQQQCDYDYVAAHPGCSPSDLISGVGLAGLEERDRVYHSLADLEQRGLIVIGRMPRTAKASAYVPGEVACLYV